MRRKLLIALAVLVALTAGAYIFARGVLASDLVRSELEQQLTLRLGQPVRIASASAAVFPRLALDLHDVTVGAPSAAEIGEIRIVIGLRGLLSRTIADAEVIVSDGRLALPLTIAPRPNAPEAAPPAGASAGFTVTSVRRLSFRNVTLTGGNRSLVVDLDSSIEGDRLDITRLTARAGTTRVEASGALSSITHLEGALDAVATPLDLDEMVATASALTSSAAPGNPAQRDREVAAPMHVVVKLTAPAGAFSGYSFSSLSTTIDIVPGRIGLAPLTLRAFGGTFEGRLDAVTRAQLPALRLTGRVSGLDLAELMKASGSAGGIAGRLGGTVSLEAAGTESDTLIRSARGSIEAAVSEGSIPGLDMVRTIVLAFGKPTGAPAEGAGTAFSRLGGRFKLADGALSSDDLSMTSRDFDMAGRGTLQLQSGALSSRADVVLSRELTAQAGTDLRRYAQDDGRVVIPATIGGTLQRPSVSLDIAAATRRALGNELQRRAKSLLEGLFRKKEK